MFSKFQKIGKAFMLPISILPAAGLLLGIGGALSNPATLEAYPLLNNGALQIVFKVMATAGEAIFANLALIIAVGLSIGLAREDKGTAALAALVSFLVMNATIKNLSALMYQGEVAVDTGVVGSMAIAALVSYLHHRYSRVQLPAFLGFFGGARFIPIITSFVSIFLGVLFFMIWPPFQQLLVKTGYAIARLGLVGTFLYGFLLRLTGAVGLHHMIYPLFWYTELGGTEIINGLQVSGAQNIFFKELADPNHAGLFTHGTRFFAGRFATMMFGLPGAALALYYAVPKDKRALMSGLFLSAALTSFLTGITEPIEFMFLFVAPWLYVLHAFFDGLSFLLADLLSIRIGNTFSGGFIDFTLFGILQGNSKTHWLFVLPLGACWFCLYYFSFSFLVKKFDLKTPGREDTSLDEYSTDINTTAEQHQQALSILAALGGRDNLIDLDACITRLRVEVKESTQVSSDLLKQCGAKAVFITKNSVQAVYGLKADLIKQEIFHILKKEY